MTSQANRFRPGHITSFIFDDGEFFSAHTDMPGVRIGRKGQGPMFNIPKGHAYYERCCEADSASLIEPIVDELISAFNAI